MGFKSLKSYGSQISIFKFFLEDDVGGDTGGTDNTQQSAYQKLLVDKNPWGRYGAESWNQNTNTLPELGGNSARDATTSRISTCMTTGNGSTANIACIGGDKSSYINWSTGSIPSTYTICAITQKVSPNGCVLIGQISRWLLGFFKDFIISYPTFPQYAVQGAISTNWQNICATNSTSVEIPNNVLLNNVPVGGNSGGTGNDILSINGPTTQGDFDKTIFNFSQLLIFDQALTASEMVIVSDAFQNYLDTGVLDSPPYLSPYQRLIKTKKPWGRYSANSLNGNTLLELGGNTSRDAVISNLTSGVASGNGAASPIAFLNGIQSSSSSITWIPGSIVPNITVCSITRYTDSNGNIVLGDKTQGSFLHGHYNKLRGISFINQFNTPQSSVGNLTDWLVICSTINPIAIPNNVLIDGVVSGSRSGGTIPSSQLVINNLNFAVYSAFEFSQLLIFDTILTAAEMVIVSDALRNYLRTGVLDTPAPVVLPSPIVNLKFLPSDVNGTTLHNYGSNGIDSVLSGANNTLPTITTTTGQKSFINSGHMNFNGANTQFFNIPYLVLPTTGFSISLWFNYSSLEQYRRLFEFYDTESDIFNCQLLACNSPAKRIFIQNVADGKNFEGGPTLVINRWYHFVWTITQSGEWVLYVDNIKYPTGIIKYPTLLQFPNANVGKAVNDKNQFMNGYMDNFRIYDTLTDDQIDAIYNST